MSEMVERVARAIAQADEQNGGPPYDWRIAQGKHVKEHLFDQARAAIEAMREPTEEMMKALRFYGMLDGDPEEAWEMTIKTAIDPSTPLVGS